MARVCLHYLSMKEFENVEVGRYISFSNLLVYSAVYWADHVRRMGSAAELEVKDFLHHVYDTTTNMFSLWFPTFWELAISKEPVPKLTPIHLAALNGHQNVVRRLLGEGQLKPNVADSVGSYPLIYASIMGYDKTAIVIIEHGGDVNAQGGPHGSPLLAACLEGHEKVVRILLEYGADANSGFKDHENPLTIAFVRSHEMIMQMLLEYGADVNTKIKDGTHILERVLLSKNTKMLRMLLMHGADANSRFRSNHILQTACVMKHDEMVQILLDFGADINAKDNDGTSVLETAFLVKHDPIVHMLLKHVADVNTLSGIRRVLQCACLTGCERTLQILLDYGINVNGADKYIESALGSAYARGHEKIVRMVLEHGAGADVKNYELTLGYACLKGQHKMLQILLKYGDAKNKICKECLGSACLKGHDKIVHTLLTHGFTVDAKNGYCGHLELYIARKEGHKRMEQMLLEHGAGTCWTCRLLAGEISPLHTLWPFVVLFVCFLIHRNFG